MSRRVVHQKTAYVSARSLLHLFSNALLLVSNSVTTFPISVQLYSFYSTSMEASNFPQYMSISKQCFGFLFLDTYHLAHIDSLQGLAFRAHQLHPKL
jgi:hypothetical protein